MATYHFSDLKTDFKKHKRILSFSEYLDLIQQKPQQQLRNSAQYFYAMLENYQSNPPSPRPVIGHQEVKESIQRSLKTFTQQGFNNKLLLLHGPNGSAKSSLVQNVMSGAEHYSQTDEGAIYSFHWIFPHETLTKQNLGIHSKSQPKAYESYAYLTDDQIAAKIPSMLNTHPFLLIPVEQRLPLLEHLLGKTAAATVWSQLSRTLKTGGLPQRCYEIFQTLLNSYQGNIDEVLKHIQVERMYFSKRYRQGLVTIEPQMHVDAQYQLLSYNRSYSQLPASLQSLNLFNLTGDLVQGNRGVVEFSDLLKRPMDAFKYLLVACETGTVTIGSCIAELDTIFIGSANELQLDAFKEFPDFMSFKARMDLIQVPYLLKASEEEKVYEQELQSIAHEKPVAPHTAWLLAHWAVLTRLKKPQPQHYPEELRGVIQNMTPLQKLKIYNTEEFPADLTPEQKKVLKVSLNLIKDEYKHLPYYEGRTGASAREMKTILYNASQNKNYPHVSPLSLFQELEEFLDHTSEYEFLKQEPIDGYHDHAGFIEIVKQEYLSLIDQEVRHSMGLIQKDTWENFMNRYVQHLSALLKNEKIKNPTTLQMESPNLSLIEELETIIEAPGSHHPTHDSDPRVLFRQSIISQIGAWSLDHPKEKITYSRIFPEFWRKLESHYFNAQKSTIRKQALSDSTLKNMQEQFGYTESSAQEVVGFLLKSRYE